MSVGFINVKASTDLEFSIGPKLFMETLLLPKRGSPKRGTSKQALKQVLERPLKNALNEYVQYQQSLSAGKTG